MTTLVLTIIGDDRAGLVKALADVVQAHDGNWERSHLAELSGTFAGVVEVSVPESRSAELQAALRPLEGLLDVKVHTGTAHTPATRHEVVVEVLGYRYHRTPQQLNRDAERMNALVAEEKPGCVLVETISNPLLRVAQI